MYISLAAMAVLVRAPCEPVAEAALEGHGCDPSDAI
jgi:hypothetical protein